jgi:SnoaL-like domain
MTEDHMEEIKRLYAVEEIKQVKARYFRGVDTNDAELVRAILSDDCVLDYRGCCTDPVTGRDFLPAMNRVMHGRAAWSSKELRSVGIVSVHEGHHCEVTLATDTTARAIWSMTDRLFMPVGAPFEVMTGYGYYHETYEKDAGSWRIERIRIDAQPWSQPAAPP